METKQPVVFICHTSEDKSPFVIPFARQLSEKGIRVSVEPWELAHGESLIEKIFTEGIKSADAFIVILSEFSVRKTWITEELRPGLVKRISTHSKLIPVVIDECEVPDALKILPVVTIKDLNQSDVEITNIAAMLYGGQMPEPAAPAATDAPVQSTDEPLKMIKGLSEEEMLVLKISCEASVEKERRFINTSDIMPELDAKGISGAVLNKSLLNLDELGYLKAGRVLGSPNIEFFNTTARGYEAYAQAYTDDFDGQVRKVLAAVVDEGLFTNDDLSTYFDLPIPVVNYIIDILVERNYVKLGKAAGGAVLIKEVTKDGKRAAKG